jgi:hypothetical protein
MALPGPQPREEDEMKVAKVIYALPGGDFCDYRGKRVDPATLVPERDWREDLTTEALEDDQPVGEDTVPEPVWTPRHLGAVLRAFQPARTR